jgi:hypothetical protein
LLYFRLFPAGVIFFGALLPGRAPIRAGSQAGVPCLRPRPVSFSTITDSAADVKGLSEKRRAVPLGKSEAPPEEAY